MSQYVVTSYEKRNGDHVPSLPEGTGFILIAAPDYDPEWGLFRCDQDVPAGGAVDSVPDLVEKLIRSGELWHSPDSMDSLVTLPESASHTLPG